jgi:hypothetical protein
MKIKIGDKIVEVDRFIQKNGKQIPVIKCTATEIKNPDGSQDVVVQLPCLNLNVKEKRKKF